MCSLKSLPSLKSLYFTSAIVKGMNSQNVRSFDLELLQLTFILIPQYLVETLYTYSFHEVNRQHVNLQICCLLLHPDIAYESA